MDVTYTIPAAEKFSGKVVASESATHLVTPPGGDRHRRRHRTRRPRAADASQYLQPDRTRLQPPDRRHRLAARRRSAAGGKAKTAARRRSKSRSRAFTRNCFWVLGLALGILALGGTMLYRRGAA